MKTPAITRQPTHADRLAIRHRPPGQPVMHQDWGKLLFMHWRIDPNLIRHLVPNALTLDLYGDAAWIGVTPFTMWDIRAFPPIAPALPGLDSMHELNVRTYVHYDGVPGVWFFSLDVNSLIAATTARAFFHLPYHHAEIDFSGKRSFKFHAKRSVGAEADLRASWTFGDELPVSQPGTREFFLTERYCLYAESDGDIYRARIYHQPWPLRKATLKSLATNIFEVNRLPIPKTEPIVHYAEEVNVDIWYLESVEDI
ncbi:MAG TPA: DUF2071 domain-containing protein [Pyrinomonadaceae bacterium]